MGQGTGRETRSNKSELPVNLNMKAAAEVEKDTGKVMKNRDQKLISVYGVADLNNGNAFLKISLPLSHAIFLCFAHSPSLSLEFFVLSLSRNSFSFCLISHMEDSYKLNTRTAYLVLPSESFVLYGK